MNVTFIATVYNEQNTLTEFLESLLAQSVIPNEIIIVDAFSKDRTIGILKKYKDIFQKENTQIKFKIYRKKGNRSTGRNFAVKKSRGDIIVASDAGCILDRNWLKNIIQPFVKKEIDVVAGFYRPVTNNVFEKCLACYTCVMEDKLTQEFLPSSRSIAFKKTAWARVGGYPEELDTCEDLVFAKKLKLENLKFSVRKNAYVWWPQRKNFIEAFKQFFLYARGDGKALYVRFQTPLLFLRSVIFILLAVWFYVTDNYLYGLLYLGLLLLYVLWAMSKNYNYVKDVRAMILLPVLQVISDFAVLLGMSLGLLERVISKKR